MKMLLRDGGLREETLQLGMAVNRRAFVLLVGETWLRLREFVVEMKETAAEDIAVKFLFQKIKNSKDRRRPDTKISVTAAFSNF